MGEALDVGPPTSRRSPETSPGTPPITANILWPRSSPERTATRASGFMPGASAPACMMAIRFAPSGGRAEGLAPLRIR